MADLVPARVWETVTVSGTGTVTLSGTAKNNTYQTFGAALASGKVVRYCIVDSTAGAWEFGIGTYTGPSPGTLTRTATQSSNAGALVNFAGNSCDVFVDYPMAVQGGGSANAGLIAALTSAGLLDGSMLQGTSFRAVPFVPGSWYSEEVPNAGAYTGWTTSLIFVPFMVNAAHTFQNIGLYCQTAPSVSTTFRLGVYADNGSSYPGSLLVDCGDCVVTATGRVAAASAPGALPQGLVWLCVGTPASLNSGAFAGISQQVNPFRWISGDAGPNVGQYKVSRVYSGAAWTGSGALPATAPTSGANWNGNSGGWAIGLQA